MRGMFRVKGRSWWAEEMPNAREYAEALRNLEQVNWKVDCILSHCGPSLSLIHIYSPTVIAAAITSRKGKHKLPTHVTLDAPVRCV